MGYFMNSEIIEHCIILSQEAFHEGDFGVCRSFLESAKTALRIFPSITEKGFDYLVELFSDCQGSLHFEDKKLIKQYGIITTLSGMLARTAKARVSPSKTKVNVKTRRSQFIYAFQPITNFFPNQNDKSSNSSRSSGIDDDVQAQLMSLCTKDGTTEQSRNAIVTLASLYENDHDKKIDVFQSLLETMTTSTRLSISVGERVNKKVVNVLETLTAMVECVPSLFSSVNGKKSRSTKAIHFALDTVLHGRDENVSTEKPCSEDLEFHSDDDLGDDKSTISTPSSAKKMSRRTSTKDSSPSFTAQRIRAAILFLTAHIRATIASDRLNRGKGAAGDTVRLAPPKEHIGAVFEVLRGILEDGGLPPAINARKECESDRDRAFLRQCATVSIMRLCDGNLQLEKEFFIHSIWHTLGKSFVDEDASVRGKISSNVKMIDISFCIHLPKPISIILGRKMLQWKSCH